jgi:hypothetical protein
MTNDEFDKLIDNLARPYSKKSYSIRKSNIVSLEDNWKLKYIALKKRREIEQLRKQTIDQRKEEAEDKRKRKRLLRPIENGIKDED